jgi:hypothetical protein
MVRRFSYLVITYFNKINFKDSLFEIKNFCKIRNLKLKIVLEIFITWQPRYVNLISKKSQKVPAPSRVSTR